MRLETAKSLLQLSPPLQVEVIMYVHKSLLTKVFFMRSMDQSFVVQVAMRFTSSVMAPGELAQFRSMYIIERGLVLYRAQIMSAGKVWGDEDIVLTEALLKYERKDRARATTYVEYRQLKRGDLMDVAEGTPVVHKRLRKIAVLVALKRYIIDYAWSE